MIEYAAGLKMHPIHFKLKNEKTARCVGGRSFSGSFGIRPHGWQHYHLGYCSAIGVPLDLFKSNKFEADQDSESPFAVTTLTVSSVGHWAISVESKNSGYLLDQSDPQARLHYLFTLGILTQEPQDLRSPWASEIQSSTSEEGLALPLSILLQTEGQMIGEGFYEDLLVINILQF